MATIPSIIPEPVSIKSTEGEFILTSNTVILFTSSLEKIVNYLKTILKKGLGLDIKSQMVTTQNTSSDVPSNTILLQIDSNLNIDNRASESYLLQIQPKHIIIKAVAPNGIFYGIQTLRQLLPSEVESSLVKSKIPAQTTAEIRIQCTIIKDTPQFAWRGLMIDEGRFFLGKQHVKEIIDVLGLLKFNILHWHLTEDQGWRIEIKKYPRLTSIGSKRDATPLRWHGTKKLDGVPHSGFYSQEDIKEIVTYAADRFITIVPEIEMPGHSVAALAAYPEYSCTGGPFNVAVSWGVKHDVYCVGKDKTIEFLKEILDECLSMFPSPVIHIGGDEVPKDRWKACPDCQAKIQNLHLENEHELQVNFTNDIADYLASKGRRLMGWNEILSDNLNPNAICHHWMGSFDKVLPHIQRGRDVVTSFNQYLYLNYTHSVLPMHKTYEFNPIPEGLTENDKKHIIGVEAALWGEVIPESSVWEQLFPRFLAVSELAWTHGRKSYDDFKIKVAKYTKRLDAMGIKYANPIIWEGHPSLLKRLKQKLSLE